MKVANKGTMCLMGEMESKRRMKEEKKKAPKSLQKRNSHQLQ